MIFTFSCMQERTEDIAVLKQAHLNFRLEWHQNIFLQRLLLGSVLLLAVFFGIGATDSVACSKNMVLSKAIS